MISERLIDLRVERGLTLEQLAESTGLSKSARGSYEADDYKYISPYSIVTLAKFYGVSADYLLVEMKNHPDTDLVGLHLNDKLKLLVCGRINNCWLCDFQRLMVDTEICVDRIAAVRVHDMNVVLAEARKSSWKSTILVKTIFTCGRWSWRKSMMTRILVGSYMMIWMGSSGISGRLTRKTQPQRTK